MPAYLDFDTTKKFRDALIARTLKAPHGPQTFTSVNYTVNTLNDYANVDPGTVEDERAGMVVKTRGKNIYKPEEYFITENLNDYSRVKNLLTYIDHAAGFDKYTHTLVSLSAIDKLETQSDLFKWNRDYVLNKQEGPLKQRIRQNLITSTIGRLNIVDALQNSSTAINIITGNEPLIAYNYKITVASTLAGKVVDFAQTVAGVEFPWTEIPGNYLTEPSLEVKNSPTTGISRLFGKREKEKVSKHPSDIMVEYMGEGQRRRLYDNLSFNKYAPNYTVKSRKNSSTTKSGFFNNVSESIGSLLNKDAPDRNGYIGDDRNNPLSDFFIEGKSTYDLAIWYDPTLVNHTGGGKNISDGGGLSGSLTWISKEPSGIMTGLYNAEFGGEKMDFEASLSTKFSFKDGSILNKTQELLDSESILGDSRSNISKVIDQTTRAFKEGQQMISKGSAVLFTGYTRDGFNNNGNGKELCRVWTKDRSYFNNSDLIRKNGLMRKFKNSVIDNTYNLNIAPISSNGGRTFEGSTNIISDGKHNGFYAKKYMFSIENLAWKTSNIPGFKYDDLPFCERGNNGGRVMWFPPYNLKVAEQNSVKWHENDFIGRPEPIYTYQNTTRNATISFSVIVDHPSIVNYMVHEYWKDVQNIDEYINSFFAGCLEDNIDFYDLLLKYPGLTQEDLKIVLDYIKGSNDNNAITTYKTFIDPVEDRSHDESGDGSVTVPETKDKIKPNDISKSIILYYRNDYPNPNSKEVYSKHTYSELYDDYKQFRPIYDEELNRGMDKLFSLSAPNGELPEKGKNDLNLLLGKKTLIGEDKETIKTTVQGKINIAFDKLTKEYDDYNETINQIKTGLNDGTIKNVILTILSSCSSVADEYYNLSLSFRRSDSVIKDVLNKLSKTQQDVVNFTWPSTNIAGEKTYSFDNIPPIPLGYEGSTLTIKRVNNEGELFDKGETSDASNINCSNQNFKTSKELQRTAPLAFYCRQTTIKLTGVKEPSSNDSSTSITPQPTPDVVPNITIISSTTTNPPKPGVDEVKKIIMKILSECYYFKLLQENSPIVYSSIGEQLKYFHPAFHSITPEGLNSRLTFLQQCIRPGDTIPIKGINDDRDLNARNTSFGPPPICVLRIGDFFHSKIAIRDINISYEDSTWDFNPEGVGMQPMIANVNMTVFLIGGHGLEKPVERLQNALSFNFYGNTEIYDHRSTATEDRMPFYKSTIEQIITGQIKTENKTITDINANERLISGSYIGGLNCDKLNYLELVENTYNSTKEFISNYKSTFSILNELYGLKLASMMLSPKYRLISDYKINTGSGEIMIPMFGVHKSPTDLSVLADNFGCQMEYAIETTNLTMLMGINVGANNATSEIILKKFYLQLVSDTVDEIKQNSTIEKLAESRNNLILHLDKLNFIATTHKDARLINTYESSVVDLVDFDAVDFYHKYEPALVFIYDNIIGINLLFDTTHDFSVANTIINNTQLSEFLGILLKDNTQKLLNEYTKIPSFNNNLTMIRDKITKFVNNAVDGIDSTILNNIPIRSYPVLSNNNPIEYVSLDNNETLTSEQQADLVYTLSTNNNEIDNLNYHRNG